MTNKMPSKKPVPPLTHAVISYKKPARLVIEHLSDSQKVTEATIIKKFFGALKDKKQRTFSDLIQTPEKEEWPDFYAKEDGINWAIELVELVVPEHAKQWSKKRDYASRSFPIRVDDARHLLENTISRKIKKRYSPLSNHKILLLIYDLRNGGFATSITDSVGLTNAHKVLQTNKHYFNEVWYVYPLAEQDQGIILKVWPFQE